MEWKRNFRNKPVSVFDMTADELDAELQKGFDSLKAGRTYSLEEVDEQIRLLVEEMNKKRHAQGD